MPWQRYQFNSQRHQSATGRALRRNKRDLSEAFAKGCSVASGRKVSSADPRQRVSAIENKVALKRRNCFGKRLVEHFLVAGEQHYLCSTLRDNAAIAIELDLKSPLLAGRQRRDRLALHRFNERGFCALLNCLVFRRLCLRLLDVSRRAELKRQG
jgi:hypothetical protein